MERVRVDSKALRSVGYDVGMRVLEVEFVSGTIYRYLDVPDYLHLGLMAADSHGAFYAEFIRNAGFDFTQIA